jgi:lysozyme
LPPAIDLEFSGFNKKQHPPPKEFQRELAAFRDEIVARYGKTPVVYSTSDFQSQYLTQMQIECLWIREIITKPRQRWVFWQFSSRGRVSGVRTLVDLNVFNGAQEKFQEFLSEH